MQDAFPQTPHAVFSDARSQMVAHLPNVGGEFVLHDALELAWLLRALRCAPVPVICVLAQHAPVSAPQVLAAVPHGRLFVFDAPAVLHARLLVLDSSAVLHARLLVLDSSAVLHAPLFALPAPVVALMVSHWFADFLFVEHELVELLPCLEIPHGNSIPQSQFSSGC